MTGEEPEASRARRANTGLVVVGYPGTPQLLSRLTDMSSFSRAFRAEFGMSPREWRVQSARRSMWGRLADDD